MKRGQGAAPCKRSLGRTLYIGKHYFHLKEYSILQLYMQAHRLHIKIAELNTHSDGNGITGIPSAVFFNEMGNKKKKIWEIKRRTKLRTHRSCTGILQYFYIYSFEAFFLNFFKKKTIDAEV